MFFCYIQFVRFLCFFLFFLLSCDKGSDLIIEETRSQETGEIYLLNDLEPGFTYPEALQYMSSREVKSGVCLDINRHIDANITRHPPTSAINPNNPTAANLNSQTYQNNDGGRDNPLRAHTCRSEENITIIGGEFESGGVSVDQGFNISKIYEGELNLPFYGVCVEVENTGASSRLVLRECNKNPKQKFVFEDDGKIKPVNDLGLCLTSSADYTWYGGGYKPIMIVRDLFMGACNPSLSERQRWGIRRSK